MTRLVGKAKVYFLRGPQAHRLLYIQIKHSITTHFLIKCWKCINNFAEPSCVRLLSWKFYLFRHAPKKALALSVNIEEVAYSFFPLSFQFTMTEFQDSLLRQNINSGIITRNDNQLKMLHKCCYAHFVLESQTGEKKHAKH